MQTDLAVISAKYKAMRAQLITKCAAIMLEFTSDSFRKQGWTDETLTPWEKRKNNVDPGRGILIGKGTAHLSRNNYIVSTTDHSVTMGNDLPYAKAQNDGFHGIVTVPAHKRKRLSKSVIETSNITKKGKPRKATVLKAIGDIDVKEFTRNMNLPQRKFMGESASLRGKIRDLIKDEVKSCFK